MNLYASIKSNIINWVIKPKHSCDKIRFDKKLYLQLPKLKPDYLNKLKKKLLRLVLVLKITDNHYTSSVKHCAVGHVGQWSNGTVHTVHKPHTKLRTNKWKLTLALSFHGYKLITKEENYSGKKLTMLHQVKQSKKIWFFFARPVAVTQNCFYITVYFMSKH